MAHTHYLSFLVDNYYLSFWLIPTNHSLLGWSQCQPTSAPPQNTPKPTSTTAPGNAWPTNRTRRTWPGAPVPTSTKGQTSTTKPATPSATGPSQLFDQCGGLTWAGSTRCVEGLRCVKIDDYYSQCQKP